MRTNHVRPKYVEFIPDHLEEGVLYISERFRTCSHKCCCGCGEEVVTPLSAAEWRLTREGEKVSLWPSIGNWDYACRSHYFIRRNQVNWAGAMTAKQIAVVQCRDAADLAKIVNRSNAMKASEKVGRDASPVPGRAPVMPNKEKAGWVDQLADMTRRLIRLLFGD